MIYENIDTYNKFLEKKSEEQIFSNDNKLIK